MLPDLIIITSLMLACSMADTPNSDTMKLNPSGDWSWSAGTSSQCTKFVVPRTGDYCEKVARFAGISTEWFMQQNPQINEKCSNLWTNTKYCVDPPNGQPGMDDSVYTEGGNQQGAKAQASEGKDRGMIFAEGETGVILHNKSPDTVCFTFEVGKGVSSLNLPPHIYCENGNDDSYGIVVPSGQSVFHHFLPDYNGAINTVVNGIRGARHEMTFVLGNPPGAFYDTDYEFGLTSSTFGPFDGRPLSNGGESLVGEEDLLAKVNQHFKELSLEEQQALVSASGEEFIKQGASGDLIWVDNRKAGPEEWWYFLQCVAKVRGYVMPGSEENKTPIPGTRHAEMIAAADNSTKEVLTQQLLLTVYPDHRQAN